MIWYRGGFGGWICLLEVRCEIIVSVILTFAEKDD
jgi:hypothetical protein